MPAPKPLDLTQCIGCTVRIETYSGVSFARAILLNVSEDRILTLDPSGEPDLVFLPWDRVSAVYVKKPPTNRSKHEKETSRS